jgi:hypothetical protein
LKKSNHAFSCVEGDSARGLLAANAIAPAADGSKSNAEITLLLAAAVTIEMQLAHLSLIERSITQLPGGRASASSDHALFGAIRFAAATALLPFCGRATFVSLALTLTTKCALSHRFTAKIGGKQCSFYSRRCTRGVMVNF